MADAPWYSIRPATEDDAAFLADVVLAATRAQGRLQPGMDEPEWHANTYSDAVEIPLLTLHVAALTQVYQVFYVARVVELGEITALDECTEARLFTIDEALGAPGWPQQHPEFAAALLSLRP